MNKRIFNKQIDKGWCLFILSLLLICISCTNERAASKPERQNAEVEIEIGYSVSRADSEPVEGVASERFIKELDLLIFEQGVFAYSRQAYKLDNSNNFRATLKESDELLTCYLFANCRQFISALEAQTDRTGETWENIQTQLIDLAPQRIVGGINFTPLPIWGKTTGTISTTQINRWGPVELLRSVASVDLYVEMNDDTDLFELTDLYLYYAPDRGYLAPKPDTGDPDNYECVSPPGMITTASGSPHANTVEHLTAEVGGVPVEYDAIIYQIYTYDNDTPAEEVTDSKRFTRAIMAGYYDQTGPVSDWKKSYYPVDFVYTDGKMRPLIRNWKYDIRIDGVFGPGYGTVDEAANNYPIDLNVDVIEWNGVDVEIGVQGRYYVSLERRKAYLARSAGSTDNIWLTYRILDDVPGEQFFISFKDDTNGTATTIANGIQNDFFEVLLLHDIAGKSADIQVKAKQSYTEGNHLDTVVIRFRNLVFEIAIEQFNSSGGDWDWSGNDDVELG